MSGGNLRHPGRAVNAPGARAGNDSCMNPATQAAAAVVESVRVGRRVRLPAEGDWPALDTAFIKVAIDGPILLGATGFTGDQQADRRYHGGPEKAALLYSADHYPSWRADFDWPEAGPGAFGENVCVEGVDESSVCIGDVWRLGEATIQVSQPRGPCSKIDRRWRRRGLTQAVVRNGRGGWYVRVLAEGRVSPGDAMTPIDRPHPEWTVLRATFARRDRKRRPDEWAALVSVPALSREWVE